MATDQHQPASSQAIAPLATHRRDDYEHWSQFWRAIANVATLTPARISDRITAFTNRTKVPTWSCLRIVCPFRQKKCSHSDRVSTWSCPVQWYKSRGRFA